MTEAEWLSATADVKMMQKTHAVMSKRRKHRLFSVACCRELGRWLTQPRVYQVLDAVERYADKKIKDAALGRWYREAIQMRDTYDIRVGRVGYPPEWIAHHVVAHASTSDKYTGSAIVAEILLNTSEAFGDEFINESRLRFPVLLRDIFGNSFRPVSFSPAWRTDTVVALARQMYEARDFSAMPILADAIQDAGCDNEDILSHCRGPGPHVRGCWVVDLVLGKE